MPDREAELQARTQAVRFLLYPVLFSPGLAAEADRVCRLFQSYPRSQILDVVENVRAELEGPSFQVSQVDALVSNPSEPEIRAYLEAVVAGLEAALLPRGESDV